MRITLLCSTLLVAMLLSCGCQQEDLATESDLLNGDMPATQSTIDSDNSTKDSASGPASETGIVDVVEPGDKKISMGARLVPDQQDPTTATVHVRIRLAQGWHLYASLDPAAVETPAELTLNETEEVTAIGDWERPDATPDLVDPLKQLWSGDLFFTQKVKLEKPASQSKISVSFSYQICNDDIGCMPPESVEIPVTR